MQKSAQRNAAVSSDTYTPKKVCYYGMLGGDDIVEQGIIKNLTRKNLKAASYDITPTAIAMSTKNGMLQPVYKDPRQHYTDRFYIYVMPKDSVLIVSNEYLRVPANVAGYISSRVKNVVNGFGHVSTTIDPLWDGAVLIALSNPSDKPIRIDVGDNQSALATVSFHYVHSASNITICEYKNMRFDLLKEKSYTNQRGFRNFVFKITHKRRREFTDLFFEYVDGINKDGHISEARWGDFLKEFSLCGCHEGTLLPQVQSMHARKYFIIDNWWQRMVRWIIVHATLIGKSCIGILFIIVLLNQLGIMPGFVSTILQALGATVELIGGIPHG